jgi:hypothetical protein
MNAFQWVTLTILGLALVRELLRFAWGAGSRGAWLFRVGVWVLAGVAIANPGVPQRIATAVGIERGADLVSYCFVLAFLSASFYFYARCVRLQRQLTEIVRHLAIREGQQGEPDARPDRPAPGQFFSA